MKVRLFLAAVMMTVMSVVAIAGPTEDLNSYVDELRFDCPVDFGNGWVAQSYDVNGKNIDIIIVADFPADYFHSLVAQGDGLKTKFLASAKELGPQWAKLVDLAVKASSSITIDMLSATGADTIEFICSPEELAGALK